MTSIAIVGAGLAGLAAARTLRAHGVDVHIFDKGFFPGGRLSTRRPQGISHTFDHGAQYFTATHRHTKKLVATWLDAGVIAPWHPKLVSVEAGGVVVPKNAADAPARYVGTPYMNSLAEHLARDLNVFTKTRITSLDLRAAFVMHAQDKPLPKSYDGVILNMPPVQADALLNTWGHVSSLRGVSDTHQMNPCWALMLSHHGQSLADFDGAFVNDPASPISWIARDSHKPGRAGEPKTWVVHAKHTWSAEHLEQTPAQIAPLLYDAFCTLVRDTPDEPTMSAHRWRYAIPASKEASGALLDEDYAVALCGDWLGGGRVEGALLTGVDAAEKMMARHNHTLRPSTDQVWGATHAALF